MGPDCSITQCLCFSGLTGRDAEVARLLAVCPGLEAHLAVLTKVETGPAVVVILPMDQGRYHRMDEVGPTACCCLYMVGLCSQMLWGIYV